MLKCLDKTSKEDVIIFHHREPERKEVIRKQSKAKEFQCPECKNDVFARLGKINVWHFAHYKSDVKCPLKSSSADLLIARQILYNWLDSKFPGQVTLEKYIADYKLKRPFDCWVETSSGDTFAYWILDKQLKKIERDKLSEIQQSDVKLHLIVLDKFIRFQDEDDTIKLSPTERELMQKSRFNKIYHNDIYVENFSLSYLNIENRIITLFRGITWYDGANIFEASCIHAPIDKCLITKKTGEIVLPGEYEKLNKS